RRTWSVPATVGLSLVGLAAYLVWVVEPSTTRLGIPTATTVETLGRHLDSGLDELRTAVVPAPVSDGALLLAITATWVMAQVADLLAFRRDATIGAVGPGLSLFIWASTLGTTDLRARTTIGFAGAAVVFLLLQHQALLERRRAWFAGRHLGTGTGLVTAGVLAGLVAVVGGVVVGPALPGAGGDALLDVRGLGNGGGGGARSYKTEPPLARIGENFLAPEKVELFTVRSPVPEYWRIAALDRYSSDAGGQWTLAAAGADEVAQGLDGPVADDAVRQEFQIVALGGRWMPAAYEPVAVDGGAPLVVKASATLVSGRTRLRGLRYSVQSELPPAPDVLTDAQRAATDAALPDELDEFVELPGDFPDDVRRLALEITGRAATPFDRARALEEFFLSPEGGFTYSLDADVELGPDAQSTDAIQKFVLETREGFCVQFAGSYAAMARAAGLPARVAVGYTTGTYDDDADVYHVSTYNAHAWPEVWLAGLGWTRFEPTPASSLPGGSALPGRAAAPGTEDDTGAATTPTTTASSTPPATGSGPPPTVDAGETPDVNIGAPDTGSGGRDGLLSFSWTLMAVTGLAVVLVTVGAAVAVIVAKGRRRARRRDREEPAGVVAGAWEEVLDRLGEAGMPARASSTPFELAASARPRLSDAAARPLELLAQTYTAARYGPVRPGPDDARQAWERVHEIGRALRDGAPLRTRVRRRLDPTPLRR
ncbi:MAG TPA: transglutaminaseTgpA domain-containing protein, partial [Acidimicrobiia bacterium]|nr:transglutaminaseTgpA domain-containing protein [Acidimicrobiia bacterium]